MRYFILLLLHFQTLAWAQHTTIDQLHFGDDRNTIQDKLAASDLFISEKTTGILDRANFNGSYRSKQPILHVEYSLHFDMSANRLKRLHFRSEDFSPKDYAETLQKLWEETAQWTSRIYEKALQAGTYPPRSQVIEGQMTYSHVWRHEDVYILSGIGLENGRYFSVISFTPEKPNILRH